MTNTHPASEDALLQALSQVGLRVDPIHAAEPRPDLAVVLPDGSTLLIEVKQRALVTGRDVPQLVGPPAHGAANRSARLVVANRVTTEARDRLREADWGWLDRRGHLHLQAPGVFVDATIAPVLTAGPPPAPLSGKVGLELASLLLVEPDRAFGIRAAATKLGRAASSVSAEFARLRAAGLVDEADRPVLPDLFDALADRWSPRTIDVASLPEPGRGPINEALRFNVDDVDQTGWALTDTWAAAAYGAPVNFTAAYPPDFYIPDEATLHRASQLLGVAPSHSQRAGSVRLAPVPSICRHRVDWADRATEERPLAHPLFVALDLAQDPGRGSEVLADWNPPEPWRRVW